jgi:superfamily II DNA or RNA helicase
VFEATPFLDERRLMFGPWQAFERDVARLLIVNGFDDVRIVAGSGDRGADVLGVFDKQLWVFQCKHTTTGSPPTAAIREVLEAGRYYHADRLIVAASRQATEYFFQEIDRVALNGPLIEYAGPIELVNLMASSPEYAPSRREPRDYQQNAVDAMRDGLLSTGRALIVLATGLGKTVVMAELVASLSRDGLLGNGSVLVLAHTRDLVDQLQKAFWHQLPSWIATHQLTGAETPIHREGITFGTVQSVASQDQSMHFFDLVLVDEAHHIGSSQYQRVIRELNPPMLGGVTATPWRGDDYDISALLGPALIQYGIAEGLQRGFLSDVDYRLLADDLDWHVVQDLSRNKYSISQLNRKLILPTRDDEAARIVRSTFDTEGRRSGLVFSPTIEHAENFAALLRRYDLRATVLSGEQSTRERDSVLSSFKAGHLDLVVTVDLFNEGIDVPDVDLLVFMRVTHSRRIFVQQLGRGLRISEGKDRVIVLDFVTDLRRIAEVIELDRAAKGESIEHLGLGANVVSFRNANVGDFLREWMLDQASLFLREDESTIELPEFEFPLPISPGSVQ